MAKVEANVVINRPLAEVFQFISVNENALQWQPGLLETRVTNDVNGPGRAWIDTIQFLGRRIETPFQSHGLAAQSEDCFSEHGGTDSHAGQLCLRTERRGRAGDFSVNRRTRRFLQIGRTGVDAAAPTPVGY